MSANNSPGRGGLITGILLVGLGALFLLGQFFDFDLWSTLLWPLVIIVPGVLFFVGMALGGRSAGPLAIPGSIVTTVGLLLLYQSLSGHWESWAYAWTLVFPTAVGVGLLINGTWSAMPSLRESGMKWITAGLVLFVVSGIFFELLLNISGGVISDVVWPALLILLGLYLLLRRSQRQEEV